MMRTDHRAKSSDRYGGLVSSASLLICLLFISMVWCPRGSHGLEVEDDRQRDEAEEAEEEGEGDAQEQLPLAQKQDHDNDFADRNANNDEEAKQMGETQGQKESKEEQEVNKEDEEEKEEKEDEEEDEEEEEVKKKKPAEIPQAKGKVQPGKNSRIAEWNPLIDAGVLLWKAGEEAEQKRLPYIGNGYLAGVINAKEMYVAGVFNGELSKTPSHRASVPNTFSFYIPGVPTTETALDTESGIYHKLSENIDVFIHQYTYVHRVHFSIIVHEIEVTSKKSRPLKLKIYETPSPASADINFSLEDGINDNTIVFSGMITQPETSYSVPTKVAVVRSSIPQEGQDIRLSPGEKRTFRYITAVRTSLDSGSSDPSMAAQLDYKHAFVHQTALRSQHSAAWKELWRSGVSLESSTPEGKTLNKITRASFYYLLSSLRESCGKHACPVSSISPGSLATNGYNGHVFWDADTWSFPPVLLFWPKIAVTMLDYRFHQQEGAALKARKYGYKGLMYPWESARTGEDATPEHVPYGELEQHITGDVAFAYRLYWYSTFDRKWLRTQAAPVISGIAEYFESRVVKEQDGSYSIPKVIPIDEGLYNGVNNSIFMNLGAKYSLLFAEEVGKRVSHTTPAVWREIADNIQIPYDSKLDIYLPYSGYKLENNPHPGSLDAIMIGYPYQFPMSQKQHVKELLLYSKDLAGPPGMQNCIISCSWNAINSREAANSLFKKCYQPVTHEPFYIWTEGENFGGCPQFLTAAGGFLQALMNGYGGIRIKEDGLHIQNPTLPPDVDQITFNQICYLGNRFTIWYDQDTVQIRHHGFDIESCPGRGHPNITHISEFFIYSSLTGRIHQIRDIDVKPFSGPVNDALRLYEAHALSSAEEETADVHARFGFDVMHVFVGIFLLIILLKVFVEKPFTWKRKIR